MSDDPGSKNNGEDLKNKILSSINTTFTGEATSRWISAMNEDAFDAVEEAVPANEGSKLNVSMAAVIDRLFDNFKRYSFEFNRTQDNREYEISCERPASMRTTAEYAEMGKPIKYCLGHLASRTWALIVQGEENRILVYITPIEHLVGFKPGLSDFPPHLEIRQVKDPVKTSRDFVWAVNEKILSTESLPVLARRLFTQLVKVSKGEAEHTEIFAMSPQEEKLALASTAAVPVDRSFEDAKADLLGQKKPLAERTFVVATPAEPAVAVEPKPAAAAEVGAAPAVQTAEKAVAEAAPAPVAVASAIANTTANSAANSAANPVESAAAASPFAANPAATTGSSGSGDRPPLNALLNPPPMPSLAASSSYPQVAAAIANGEPKALNAPATVVPPIPASLPASAPAPTLVAEPSQLSNDEAIAALIFPEPPRPAGSPAPPPLPPQVPTAVPVAVSLPPFVTAGAQSQNQPQSQPQNQAQNQTQSQAPTPTPAPAQTPSPNPTTAADPAQAETAASAPTSAPGPEPVHMPEAEAPVKVEATAGPAAEFAADLASASALSMPSAKAEVVQWQAFPAGETAAAPEKSAAREESQSDQAQTAPKASPTNSNLEITGQHSGGKINVADNNGKPSLEKESAEAKRNIAQSLKGLFDSLDGAISGLTAVGLEAMHSDDIDTVSSVMKQTKALKSLRESVVTLSKDWQKTIE